MSDNLKSILKGAGVAAAGAALTVLAQLSTSTDLGVFGPVVGAVLSVAVNALRKYAGTPEAAP